MSETEQLDENKGNKKNIILSFLFFAITFGAFFYMSYSGITNTLLEKITNKNSAHSNFNYIYIEPISLNIGSDNLEKYLKFSANIEVKKEYTKYVEGFMPQIIDMLNLYLRSIDIEDLQDRTMFLEIKSHIYSRILFIVGEGKINDILISEFIIS